MKNTLKIGVSIGLILTCCLFVGLSGCSAQEFSINSGSLVSANATPLKNNRATNSVKDTKQYQLDGQTIYTYLLFNRALNHGDIKGIVFTLRELTKNDLPEFIFMDAGIFALGSASKEFVGFIEKGLDLYPMSTPLNMLYAELLQKIGRNKDAIEHIQDFIEENPQSIDGKVELALLLINAAQFTEAEKILSAIPSSQRTGHIDYYHAKALQSLNRKAEAMRYLEQSIQKIPHFVDALNDLGFMYEQQKNIAKAIETYEKMLGFSTANAEVALRLIMLSLRQDNAEKALEYFEKYPMTPSMSVTVASLFVDAGYNDIAEPILLALLDIKDSPQELYFYVAAIAYARDRDIKKAYNWLKNITKDNKAYARALLLRMQLLMDLQRLDEALLESREGKFSIPEDPEFWMAEIRILATQGKLNEALNNVNAIFTKWPKNIEIAYLRATLLDRTGNKKGAFLAMEDIIKQDPNYFYALNYIGYTLAEENRDLQRAINLLRRAVSLSPESNFILDSLAWALHKARKNKEAWEVINEAIAVSPVHDPAIWEHYADIARTLGKKKEARHGYNKALEFLPENASSIQRKLNQL